MKYLEFTFRTSPCTEVINDVLSAILGDAGFESFVEQEGGIAAYWWKRLWQTVRCPPLSMIRKEMVQELAVSEFWSIGIIRKKRNIAVIWGKTLE